MFLSPSQIAHANQSIVYVIFDIHDDDANNNVIEQKSRQKDSHTLESHNHLVSYITLIFL